MARRASSSLLAVALVVCGAGWSCVLGGFDFDKAPPGSGGRTAGGGGAAGGQGTGAGEPCTTVADCPGVDGECQHRSCDGGACAMIPLAADTPLARQNPQD